MTLNKIWKKKTSHDHYGLLKRLLLSPTILSCLLYLLIAFMAITIDCSVVFLSPLVGPLGCFTFFSHSGQCCKE